MQATNEPSVSAAIKPASGVVPGAIAVLSYRQAAATPRAGTGLLHSTESDRRTDTAREMLSLIKDDKVRDDYAGRLALQLAWHESSSRLMQHLQEPARKEDTSRAPTWVSTKNARMANVTGMNWNGQEPFLEEHAEHSCRFWLGEHLLNFRVSGLRLGPHTTHIVGPY